MKKRLSVISLILAVITALAVLASCGADTESYSSNGSGYYQDGMEDSATSGSVFNDEFESTEDSKAESVKTNRKVIEYVTLNVQTKEYDTFIASVTDEIAALGGYIESSEISGSDMDFATSRSATIKIRVPSDKSGELSEFVSENSTVTRKETSTQDVTLEYVDTESRIKALTSEKEALEKMLAEAKTVDNIITIRSQLSDVIYEIESYESRLRTMDDLIEFTTITLYVREVERTAVVEKQTTWQKIGTNLKNNFQNVGEGIVSFFVFFVSAIPYLLVVGVIAAVVLIIVFTSIKKKRKKRALKAAQTPVINKPDGKNE